MKKLLLSVIALCTLVTFGYSAAPLNDACSGATTLTQQATFTCGSPTAGTTNNATDESPVGTCGGPDVWFKFVATSTSAIVTVDGATNFDAVVGAFTACGSTSIPTGGDCIDDTSSGGIETMTLTGLTVGATYYIQVSDWAGGTSATDDFDICVFTLPPPPPNDNCAGATAFPAISLTPGVCSVLNNQTTAGATDSGVTPTGACSTNSGTEDDDVWFSFVATSSALNISAVLVSGASDVYWQVFSGSCGSSMTSLLCTDNDSGSILTGLVVGQTYYLRMYTWDSGVSTIQNICISAIPPPPTNDNCVGATPFPTVPTNGVCSELLNQSTAGATDSGVTPSGACTSNSGAEDDDVWFSFVASSSNISLSASYVSGATDIYFQVFSGSCGTNMTSILCTDTNAGGSLLNLVVGETYYVRMYTWDIGAATVQNLCLKAIVPTPGKECVTATPLCCGATIPAPTAGVGSFDEAIPNECSSSNNEDNSTWISIAITADGSVSMNFDANPNADIDFALWVIRGTPTNPATLLEGCASLAATPTSDRRCDWSGSGTESGFGTACGAGTGCDPRGNLNVQNGDLIIAMINDFSAFDNFAFSSNVSLTGGAMAACPPPNVYVENGRCSDDCGVNTGTQTIAPGISVSNCPATATVIQYSTDNGANWINGVPAYGTYTTASPLLVRCNNAGGTCPTPADNITTSPVSCAPCITCVVSADAGIDGTITCASNITGVSIGSATSLAGHTYAWSPTAGLSSSTINNPIANPAVSTTYVVTVTNTIDGGCTSTDMVVITVNKPTPTVDITDLTVCQGSIATITATSGTPGTFTWNTGQNGSVINATILTTLETFTVTVTNAQGCTASATQNIAGVAISALGSGAIICPGVLTSLTVTTNPTTGINYAWSNGGNTSVISVNPLVTTIYTVTVTRIDFGCAASLENTITVNPAPVAAAIGATVCFGQDGTLTATGGVTYAWSNGAITQNIITQTAGIYTVTVTDINSCTSTSSAELVVNPLPVIVTTNATICNGSTGTITASGGTSYEWNLGANTSMMMDNPTVNTLYTVTVTTASGCTSTATAEIIIQSFLVPIMTSSTICSGSEGTISASGGTMYTWNTGETTAYNVQSPGGTTTYFVTVSDASGCSGTGEATITVNEVPILLMSNSTVCAGLEGTLTARVFEFAPRDGNSGPFSTGAQIAAGETFIWSSGENTSSINPTVAGDYTVTVTSLQGCSTTGIATLTLSPAPIVATTNSTVCSGLAGTLTASGGVSYTWSSGENTSAINPTVAGDYTVSVSNAQGCTASGVASLSISPLAVVVTTNSTVCAGVSGTLTASGGASYTWSSGENTSSINPTVAGDYSVTITTAEGCNATGVATLVVNPLPIVTTTNSTVCIGTQGTLTASGGASYVWSNGVTTSNNVTSVAGTYTVTISSAEGCTAVGNATLVTNPLPIANATSASICFGGNGTLTASGGTIYAWSNGVTIANNITNVAGTYTVTVSDINGCQSTTTATLFINPLLVASTSNATVCTGTNGTLSASGGLNYTWSNGTLGANNIVNTAGIYTVSVTDALGCLAVGTAQLFVNPLPVPVILATDNSGLGADDLTICAGSSSTLTATGGTSYNWSNGVVGAANVVNPIGTTVYTVTVSNVFGCTAIRAVTLTATSYPVPSITFGEASGTSPNDGNICNGSSAVLTASGGSSYVWSTGATTASFTTSEAGTYTVTVSSFGCPAVASATLTVLPAPTVVTGPTSVFICSTGGSIRIGGTAIAGYTYAWTPTTGLSDPNSSNPTASPSVTTQYTLVVTNSSTGCTSSGQVMVTLFNTTDLICRGKVNLSLGPNCTYALQPGDVLVGNIGSPSLYTVSLTTMAGTPIPNVLNASHIGQMLVYMVRDNCNGNLCWGQILVEDKMPPVFVCQDYTVSCTDTHPASFYAPTVTDNCGSVLGLTYTEREVSSESCDGPYWRVIERVWTATDTYGSTGTCVQRIYYTRLTLGTIGWPQNYDGLEGSLAPLECRGPWDLNGNNYPDVEETGSPAGNACNIGCTYRDEIIKVCGDDAGTSAIEGSYKVLRIWTCLDWCTGQTTSHIQIIKIADHGSPVVACPVYPTRPLTLGLGAPGNLVASEGTNVTLSTDYNSCLASYNFPSATYTDVCGSALRGGWMIGTDIATGLEAFRINTNGGIVRNIPVGNYTVCYYLEDQCDKIGSCCMTLAVRDYVSPVAVCKTYLTIGLGDNGRGRIQARDFDNGSYDNCGVVSWKIRRMTDPCHSPAITSLRDTVAFCCTDVNKKIAVVMRITDANGNYNECMDSVLIQDKLPPIITCPPDINIDCRYPYSLSNLDIFGTVVNGGNGSTAVVRDPIYIDQRYGHIGRHSESAQDPHFQVGVNGVAYDNCNLTLSYSQSPSLNCNKGTILRTWTASDAAGFRSCLQTITVYNTYEFNGLDANVLTENSGQPPYDVPFNNYNPLTDLNWDDMHDIYWPADYTTNQCGAALDTANIAWPYKKPWFREDVCSNIGVGFDDWYFDFEVGSSQGCKKVIRKWKVLDLCQKNEDGTNPVWTYDQVLVVMNSSAPTFTNCAPVEWCHNGPGCGPHYQTLSITATDDCDPETKLRYRYQVDLNNDGTFDSFGTGSTINPAAGWILGTHRVVWEVEDGCGNKETCTQIVTINDCKKPSPVCIELIAELMPSTCAIELWASDFIAANSSTDNCPGPYRYTFDAAGLQPNRIFTKDDLGRSPINIYMWDAAGNSDFCITTVTIQKNMPCTNDVSRFVLTGTVKTETNANVSDTKVSVMSGTNELAFSMTNTSGTFGFNEMDANNYEVVPKRDDNHRNGVSTADIIKIQRHILGAESLNSGYKMIAGDVNKSNTITAADLVELRKLVLFKIDRFGNNTSFRFVDKDYNLTTGNALTSSFPERVSLTNAMSGNVEADFVAVKIGDVTENAVVNLTAVPEERSGKSLMFNVAEGSYKAGETVRMTLKANDFAKINGYQFTTNFDNQRLEFVGYEAGKLHVTEENFGFTMLEEGKITTSWSNPTAESITENEGAFTLIFKARSQGLISESVYVTSELTPAQAYNAKGEMMNVGLNFIGKDGKAVQGFALYQNQPNPWGTETLIGFNLPAQMKAKVSIYDVTGKVLKVVERTFNKGYNAVTLNKGELPATGVMYYQLDAADFTDAKKMIILD
ncbi:MAG: T9SS type A sorting domain-containing protein [Saprospiraceae bacterium]|nr:T9SS type A sorting domain-containing protein [Saprospiraceae bacterium]